MAFNVDERLTLTVGAKLTRLIGLYRDYLERKNGLKRGELCNMDVLAAIVSYFFLKHGGEIWPDGFTALPKSYLNKYGKAIRDANLFAKDPDLERFTTRTPRNPNLPDHFPSPATERHAARARKSAENKRSRANRKRELEEQRALLRSTARPPGTPTTGRSDE